MNEPNTKSDLLLLMAAMIVTIKIINENKAPNRMINSCLSVECTKGRWFQKSNKNQNGAITNTGEFAILKGFFEIRWICASILQKVQTWILKVPLEK